jgi:hypothetical protein
MPFVIPAQAGIQGALQLKLDSRLRGNDDVGAAMTTSARERRRRRGNDDVGAAMTTSARQ